MRCGSLTHSGLVESSGESQWELLSLADNTQRGSQQRMIEKVKYFSHYSQQSTAGIIEMAGMERLQLEEQRDRAREEMSKIKEEREKEKHMLEVLMEKKRESIRRAEEERDRALLEKSQTEENLKAKAREAQRMITMANQERDRALEAKKEIELQLSMEKEGVEERARTLERERDQARLGMQKEKEKSVQERNISEERTKLLKSERDSAIEGSRRAEYEIKRAIKQVELEKAGKREAEILITKRREERDQARVEVQKEKEKSIRERNRSEEKTKLLKSERDSAIEGCRRAEYECERAMKQVELEKAGKKEAETLITKEREEYSRLVNEKQKLEKRCRFLEQENDRAKEEIERERHEKQKAEMLMRKADNERTKILCQLEEAKKNLRVQKGLAETMQKSEIEGEYKMEEQTAKVEIKNLLMSRTEKAIEAEKLAKVLEREKERFKTDLENMETRAIVTKAKLSENETEIAQEIIEREYSIAEEREEESRKSDEERDELKKEHEIMRMKLEQAEMKANELQEKLEDNERKEQEKLKGEPETTKPYNEERLLEVNKDDNIEREKDEVIAEKIVKVTNEEQHIVWEGYGLRLHIPPNSLTEGCSELQLNMTVSRARDCELPDEDGILVSAVYSFSHNLGERKLRQKATLEMQHCAQGSYTPLCIVRSDSIVSPHKFQTLQGGKFDSSDRYASIELDHFCSFGVYLAWLFHRNLSTRATLFYTNIRADSFHFLLYIYPDLDAIARVCCNLLLFIFNFSLSVDNNKGC